MGLTSEQLAAGLNLIAQTDRRVAEALAHIGIPEPRHRPRGYNALLRTLIAPQISTHGGPTAARWRFSAGTTTR